MQFNLLLPDETASLELVASLEAASKESTGEILRYVSTKERSRDVLE